jgi:glycosyltransferase involved in cell wall biosynthesis
MTQLLAVAPAGDLGGAELGLLRLLARLRRRGWNLTLTSPRGGPLRDAALAAGLVWERLPVTALAGGRARRLARGADAVYLSGAASGRLLGTLRGKRTILHVHELVEHAPRGWKRADVILADSHAAAERLGRLAERTHVVGCPIEPDPRPVQPPWPPSDGPVVGYVGRIEPSKGVDDLVRAAPALSAAGARVVVVGDDPYASAPQYVTALKSTGAVEHYGWVDGAAGLLQALDVLVYPSREEPFGTVPAEAMNAGTPVVATHAGGLAELVDDGVTGRLVPPDDPGALATAVIEVLANRRAMGAAARTRAVRWHADRHAARVAELIAPHEAPRAAVA